jgi:phosphoenolpyruvate synthase/pyruvate phosphate dikinase
MYIKSFQQISKDDISVVGGKGASLGELTQIGIPVPPGFVITTQAYKNFGKSGPDENFKKVLNEAFNQLATDRVAVRSSAVAEDSSNASWAGQLESFLNVPFNKLLENIANCWDSIDSARAKDYAHEHNAKDDELLVAVVIQKMINSEASGVLFTANPITKNKEEIIIDAGYGLGELIVQGEIIPDNYIVEKNSLSLVENFRGDQKRMLVFHNAQNEEIPVPEYLKTKSVLDIDQIQDLSTLGLRIEDHYNSPQDIEWALEKNKFYIIQSRPITTL